MSPPHACPAFAFIFFPAADILQNFRGGPYLSERILSDIAKGDVLGVARLAGIMAAKKVDSLIPLAHPLAINKVTVDFDLNEATHTIGITATVGITGKTGVEMEALTAVSVAALTIYDMCKAVDKGMIINNIRLERKIGGKSGSYQRNG